MTDYQNNSIKRKQIEYKVKIEYQLAVLEKLKREDKPFVCRRTCVTPSCGFKCSCGVK